MRGCDQIAPQTFKLRTSGDLGLRCKTRRVRWGPGSNGRGDVGQPGAPVRFRGYQRGFTARADRVWVRHGCRTTAVEALDLGSDDRRGRHQTTAGRGVGGGGRCMRRRGRHGRRDTFDAQGPGLGARGGTREGCEKRLHRGRFTAAPREAEMPKTNRGVESRAGRGARRLDTRLRFQI